MPRRPTVRLRFTGPRPRQEDRDEAQEENIIMDCLDRTALSIRADRCYQLPDGSKVSVHDESDVDKILGEACRKLLLEIGLEPFCPPEKMARQTVVVKTRSALIHSLSGEDLIKEVRKQHPKALIASVWKDRAMGIVKIVCKNTSEAEKIMATDLKLKGYTMRAEDLEPAEYIPIKQCLQCYRLEDHVSGLCVDTGIYCGECGSTSHRHTECTSAEKNCINCIRSNIAPDDRKHNARSNTCPLKKSILRKKRREGSGDQSDPRDASTTRTYQDAPPPTSNAWAAGNSRSQSRGRGRGRGASRGRGGSAGGRHRSTTSFAEPATPQPPPANTEQVYPELARNRQDRKKKNRNRRKGRQQAAGAAQEQFNGTSAPGTAATGAPAHYAAPQAMEMQMTEPVTKPPPPPAAARVLPNTPARTSTHAATALAPSTLQGPAHPSIINVILTASHQHNMVRPGEFNKRANELLAGNHLPPVNLGNDWHSAEFIAMISGGSASPIVQCQCTCTNKSDPRTQQRTTGPTAPPSLSPEIQVAPLQPSQSPPPAPFTADVTELVLLDEEMDTHTQGLKRRRESQSPTTSPAPDAASKRPNNEDTSDASDPVIEDLTLAAPQGSEQPLTTPAHTEPEEEVTTPVAPEKNMPPPDPPRDPRLRKKPEPLQLDPLSPDETFADALEVPADTPASEKEENSNDYSETTTPNYSRLMPPVHTPVDVTPLSFAAGPLASPKGHTPLKRTSSKLSLAQPFPSTPTDSQLDRALEEACKSKASRTSQRSNSLHRDKTRGQGERLLRRSNSNASNASNASNLSSASGLGERRLNDVDQCLAAAEIVWSRIAITTSDRKIFRKLEENIHAFKMTELIKHWRRGSIIMEILPKLSEMPSNHDEFDFSKNKFDTLTRLLYGQHIAPEEWEKYDGTLNLLLCPSRIVSQAHMDRKTLNFSTRMKENKIKYKGIEGLESFLRRCVSPAQGTAGRPKLSGDRDFFDPSQEADTVTLHTLESDGWTQNIPSMSGTVHLKSQDPEKEETA